jgi:hypothetical protein
MDFMIEISNEPVLEFFNRLITTGEDMSPIMDAIGVTLESRVSARFITRTDPEGNAWAPWKPSRDYCTNSSG